MHPDEVFRKSPLFSSLFHEELAEIGKVVAGKRYSFVLLSVMKNR